MILYDCGQQYADHLASIYLVRGRYNVCGKPTDALRGQIAEKTGLGRTWIGVVLLATVTSLPELFTRVSSVVVFDVPDIARQQRRTTVREPQNVLLLSRILVATDLSAGPERAIARAVQLADEHRATLTILHVLPDAVGDEASKRQIVLQVEKYLHRKVIKLSPHREKTVSIQVATGTAFVEIIRRAREKAVDIILVGAHGEQFINKLLFGTTAERIVRRGDRPVLVVKRRVRGPYRTVLVPTDFSDQSGQALALAMRVAPGAKYLVLHAYQGIEQQLWRSDFPKSDILRYRRELAKQSREQLKHFIHQRGLDNTSFTYDSGPGK